MNAGEATRTGSAEELHNYGFGLIVGSVRGGDGVEALLPGEIDQPLVSQIAGGMLDAEFVGGGVFTNVGATGEERQVVTLCQISYKVLVGVGGITAQLMVEVSDNQYKTHFRGKFQQYAEQGDRVGASGDGHCRAVARV